MKDTRIIVTGMGVIASLGAGAEEFEEALYAGRSGLGRSTLIQGRQPEVPAYEVPDFDARRWLGRKGIRALDRSARLLSVAACQALEYSGLAAQNGTEGEAPPDLGIVNGTMFGSVHSIASFDLSGLVDTPRLVNPMAFPNTVINSPAGQAAIKHHLCGINSTVTAGLASGLYAIQYASDMLRLGRASALLAGGAEESCQESFLGFLKNGLLSPRGKLEPFGKDRDGTVLGEGSALLVLESEDQAGVSGRPPLAEVCGFGEAHSAADSNALRAGADAAAQALETALQAAGITFADVGLIVSGASGSRLGDKLESLALKKTFDHRLRQIPVCAPKAAFGEALGASGALLAVTAVLALRRQQAPPTAGFSECGEELSLSAQSQPLEGEYALVNSLGCDGNYAALVLRRWPD